MTGRREHPTLLRRVRWSTEAALFAAATSAMGRVSPAARLAIGSALGTLFWAVARRHRHNARRNITLALGSERSGRELDALVRASMRHFGRQAVDSLGLLSDAAGREVPVDGLEHLTNARARGLGVIGVSGHFGHWELLRLVLARHGMRSTGVARPLDNPKLDSQVTRLRESGGNRIFTKRGAVPAALKSLRAGGFVTVLIDQRPERSGTPVTLLGQHAFAAGIVAVLALRTGASIVPGFGYLDASGSWRVVIEPEVPVVRTKDPRADILRITAECTAVLERWIRRFPEQWLWTHARFKA